MAVRGVQGGESGARIQELGGLGRGGLLETKS